MTDPSRRSGAPSGYFAGFVVLGLMLNVIGPSLTHLLAQVHVNLATISAVFVTQALGYLVGSVASGRAYDRGGGHRVFSGALGMCSVALVLASLSSSLVATLVLFGLIGVAAGCVDVGGNTLLVWSTDGPATSRLNVLHLCFGLGAVACPTIIDWSLFATGRLVLGYGICAAASAAVGAWLWSRPSPDHPRSGTEDVRETSRPVLGVISCFFLLYVGVELGFAGWVHAYAEAIHLGGRSSAALLTTTFWLAFIAGRSLASVFAHRASTGALLLVSTIGTVVAAAALVLADAAPLGVWLATALFGLALAPQFPTMIAHAGRSLTITGSATSWFIGAAAIGGLTAPWIIGQLFESVGAVAMPRIMLVGDSATLGWFGVVTWVLRRRSVLR